MDSEFTNKRSIWFQTPALEDLNRYFHESIHGALGIVFTKVDPEFLEAEMPIDARTHQMNGYLHGGASVVLAESLGSVASYFASHVPVDVFGIEVNASHLNAFQSGTVVARGRPIRIGNKIMVWSVDLHHKETNTPVCTCRLTVYAIPKKN